MAKLFDTILNAAIAFNVKIFFHPKVYFEGGTAKDSKTNFRPEGPCIIISNHTGHMDGPVLNTVMHPTKVHTLAAKDRFEQRIFGYFLRHTYCIPIDRQHTDTSWIHISTDILKKDGECVAIYPEGRHGKHREQLPFHSGGSLLAVLTQMPVLMIYCDGPQRWFRSSRMIVGKPYRIPVPGQGISAPFLGETTTDMERRMVALMNDLVRQLGE